ALGGKVRAKAYHSDALEVASEFARRARHNAESLVVKLDKLGYEFSTDSWDAPQTAFVAGQIVDLGSPGEIVRYLPSVNNPFDNPEDKPGSHFEKSMAEMFRQGRDVAEHLLRQREERRAQNSTGGALENPAVFDPPSKNVVSQLDFYEDDFGGP